MSFGRWLLIHSFSIFLVGLFLLGYLYRDELQLEQVYQQILSSGKQKVAEVANSDRAETLQSDSKLGEATAPAIDQKEADPVGQEPSESAMMPPQEMVADSETLDFLQSTPTVSKTIIELDDLLFKARKAYWDKDYPLAISYYQQLIEDDGDNPDYIGELGNIYYSINDFENASQLYYQAAIILIAKNRVDQARSLLSPITAMNRELGDKLKQKLLQ